ncbi:hypothetical protein [Nocardiopsis coralliicola]
MTAPDGERRVAPSFFDDDLEILPDITDDERGDSWGESGADDDTARLTADRPPHWG